MSRLLPKRGAYPNPSPSPNLNLNHNTQASPKTRGARTINTNDDTYDAYDEYGVYGVYGAYLPSRGDGVVYGAYAAAQRAHAAAREDPPPSRYGDGVVSHPSNERVLISSERVMPSSGSPSPGSPSPGSPLTGPSPGRSSPSASATVGGAGNTLGGFGSYSGERQSRRAVTIGMSGISGGGNGGAGVSYGSGGGSAVIGNDLTIDKAN